MNEKDLKIAQIIFGVGVILILVSPFILTRALGIIEFDDKSGVIGDTIGGITAPIAALLGAILVFYALKAQVNANALIFNQFEHQKRQESYTRLSRYISGQIDLIREDINQFTITIENRQKLEGQTKRQFTQYIGAEAIWNTLDFYRKLKHESTEEEFLNSNHRLVQIKLILERINYLL